MLGVGLVTSCPRDASGAPGIDRGARVCLFVARRDLLRIALCLVNTIGCADTGSTDTSVTGNGSTTAGSSSSSGGTPTTGSPTTGTVGGTSSGSDSATGSGTSGTSTSTSTSTSTGTSTSTDSDASTAASSSSGETGVMPGCDGAGSSDLAGVCIVFPPQQDSFTLAEAKAGVLFNYQVVVLADVMDVTTEAINICDQPGPGGLFVGERIEGNGQSYCLCDQGKCPNPMVPPFVLAAGVYPDSLPWDGVNWSGPSDFNNPKGPPFPPGMYTVTVRAIGQHAGQAFEVIGELPITLTP